MAEDNKDKKSSVIPGTPDYYGTGGEILGWLNQNFGNWAEANPGWLQAKSILGGAQAGFCPAGAIIDYGGSTAPSGWVLCDGSTYDATTNPGMYLNLFTAIGVLYGGTGQSSFKVPDFQGRGSVMKGTNASVSTIGTADAIALANRQGFKHNTANNLTAGSAPTLTGTTTFLTTFNKVVHNTQAGPDPVLDTTTTFSSGTVGISAGGAPGGSIGANGANLPADNACFLVVNRIIKL